MSATTLSAVTISRLEKSAYDNGFDLPQPREGNWLAFASTQAPLRVWLSTFGEGVFMVGLSQANVAQALGEHGTPQANPLPSGAVAGRTATSFAELHQLLRRAFQLSQTLPDELLAIFEKETATLPRATETERLTIQRIGQDVFRKGLIDYWEGRCAVTGLAVLELLRASHIKPWAQCATDAERLDVYNGLLLAPHLDAAFDRGLITFSDTGHLMVSSRLDESARAILGFEGMRLRMIEAGHRRYLAWHHQLFALRKP